MKKGYPCNERTIIGRAGQDRISYTFLSEDGNTPSECCIRIGDRDPLTGEPISDVFFEAYRKIHNNEVYHNSKAERAPFTAAEKAARKEERQKIEEAFEKEYGYKPSEDTVSFLLDERWGNRYNIHTDALVDEDGENYADRVLPLSDPAAEAAFPGNGNEASAILREFAETLTDRMLDVYNMMLEKYSGSAEPTRGKDLADKWNVCPATIVKDQKRLEKMIRDLFAAKTTQR